MREDDFGIQWGEYQARVTTRGGALRQLRYQGRDLVVPFGESGAVPDYRGVICAPWPNRITDGTYTVEGRQLQAALNDREHNAALHGLVFDKDWKALEVAEGSVSLGYDVVASDAYPFDLHIEVRYTVDEAGLHGTVRSTNRGAGMAPYGVCPHPYLIAGDAPLDEWSVSIPATRVMLVDEERMTPREIIPVDGTQYDFRQERELGDVRLDHAYTGISWDENDRAKVQVFDPSGTGVELSWDRQWPWLQVHTADRVDVPTRIGLAVEPMSCPPDAFNSGVDLIRLAAGESHEASWSIAAVSR